MRATYADREHFIEVWRAEHDGADPPMHMKVCPSCRGRGVSTAYLGTYTQSDREEMGEEWYEFMDDVRAGHYDRTCDECKGRNVVPEFSGEAADEWAEWEQEAADDYRTRRAESGYAW